MCVQEKGKGVRGNKKIRRDKASFEINRRTYPKIRKKGGGGTKDPEQIKLTNYQQKT